MPAFDELNKAFNIEPSDDVVDIVPSDSSIEPIESEGETTDMVKRSDKIEDREKDYQYARSHLHNLIQKMQETMDSAMEVAQQSDSARAFEVVFQGAKHTADIVDKLQDLHAKDSKLNDDKPESSSGNVNNGTVTNNVFMSGTTADLLNMLKQAKSEDK